MTGALVAAAIALTGSDETDCELEPTDVVGRSPVDDFEFVRLPKRVEKRAIREMDVGAGEEVELRSVLRGDRQVAAVIGATGTTLDRVIANTEEGIEFEDAPLAGTRGYRTETTRDGKRLVAFMGSYGCAVFFVVGRDEDVARKLAGDLAADAP